MVIDDFSHFIDENGMVIDFSYFIDKNRHSTNDGLEKKRSPRDRYLKKIPGGYSLGCRNELVCKQLFKEGY